MRKIHYFFYRLACFFDDLYTDYWTRIDVSIKAAIIGAAVSLFVVYLQKCQQDNRDKQQQSETEQKKLKYLNFLIQDTYKVVHTFNENAEYLYAWQRENPFDIKTYGFYSPKSLEIIVDKLNQEDYYLASTNQLKRYDIAEVFLLYNAIYQQLQDDKNHYFTEFPKLADRHIKLAELVNQLQLSVNQILLIDKSKLNQQEQIAQIAIHNLIIINDPTLYEDQNYKNRLNNSYPNFIQPILKILSSFPNFTNQWEDLYKKAHDAERAYNLCLIHQNNILDSNRKNKKRINEEIEKVKKLTLPLEDFLSRLNKRN